MTDTTTNRQTDIIEAPDLSQVLSSEHYNQWVALSSDYRQVLASAASVKELAAKLSREDQDAKPVFYKVPAKGSYYIPSLA